MIRIAIDAMGADGGLAPVAAGAAQLTCEDTPIHLVLVGDESQLRQALASENYDPKRIELVDAPHFVAMTDKPGPALAAQPDCSIAVTAKLVQEGEASALVSAGNTGAVILASSRAFKRVPGVRRVGLAAVYPTMEQHGPHQDPFALMLDVGATLNCSAEDLVAFAVMGSAYSHIISDIPRPRVALLSNGTEASKGTAAIVAAHQQLRDRSDIEFIGNIEGLDIPRGTADVIVCEGFVGNIVLKMLEGVSEVAKDLAKHAYDKKLVYKIGLAMLSGGIRKMRALTDWKQYGGAPIVGFDHTVIKAHGRSNARAIRNAVKVAAKTVRRGLCEQIQESMILAHGNPA